MVKMGGREGKAKQKETVLEREVGAKDAAFSTSTRARGSEETKKE